MWMKMVKYFIEINLNTLLQSKVTENLHFHLIHWKFFIMTNQFLTTATTKERTNEGKKKKMKK